MIEDVVVGAEDAIGEPVVADQLPDVFDRVELGRFGRQRDQGDVEGDIELVGEVPAGLVEQQHGMGSRRHRSGDFCQMQRHRSDVAARQSLPRRRPGMRPAAVPWAGQMAPKI